MNGMPKWILRARSSSRQRGEQPPGVLEDTGLLKHILQRIGQGEHFFLSTVCTHWRKVYKQACPEPVTTLKAVYSSASKLRLAYQHGCDFEASDKRTRYLAGWYGDKLTLIAACELGMCLDEEVLAGAAKSGQLDKVIWLRTEKQLSLNRSIAAAAI